MRIKYETLAYNLHIHNWSSLPQGKFKSICISDIYKGKSFTNLRTVPTETASVQSYYVIEDKMQSLAVKHKCCTIFNKGKFDFSLISKLSNSTSKHLV